MRLQFGLSTFLRTYGREPEVALYNRFFERAPANLTEQVALLSRPGSTMLYSPGVGPIRGNFSMKGLFLGNLFTVSLDALYRFDGSTTTPITGTISQDGSARFAGVRGAGFERVFIADGQSLQYYGGQAYSATLTLTPGTIADDVVRVDSTYYQFAADPTTGTPDGTVGNPYLVDTGASNADALSNLRKAINATGVGGVDYSVEITVANARVTANANTATTVSVRGVVAGALDPIAPVTVTATGGADGLAWDVAQLTAGAHVLYGVATPDSVGILDVTVLDSFVLCVAANSQRIYFIRPGETTIDPLDFFEAESEPDQLIGAIAVGSQVWLLGQSSIEPWVTNGVEPIPFQRLDGSPISRGTIQGTSVKIANSVITVGDDNMVYQITGGPKVISTPAISERIRKALEIERASA